MRSVNRMLVVAAAAAAWAGPGRADVSPAVSRADLDARAKRAAFAVADLGSDLFNAGNPDACYRLYEGALMALKPMLDHRPEAVQMIEDKLARAKKQAAAADKAFTLRAALDEVLKGSMMPDDPKPTPAPAPRRPDTPRLNDPAPAPAPAPAPRRPDTPRLNDPAPAPAPAPVPLPAAPVKPVEPKADLAPRAEVAPKPPADPTPAAKKSLWDRLGGEKAVRAVVYDFVQAAAADPKVNFTRNGKYPLDDKGVAKLEQHLVEFVSSATGGPLKYTGQAMKPLHKGMKITDAEFNAAAADLAAVLKKFDVPKAETDELLGIVGTTRKDIVEEVIDEE